MSQLERILYINRTIEQAGGVRTGEVVATFEISRRQVLRDIAYLRDRLGAPIIYERANTWYTYSESFSLFNQSNERLLVTGAIFRSLVSSHGLDSILTHEASDLLHRQVEGEYRFLEGKISFHHPIEDWPDWQVFASVLDAMRRNLRLTLTYQASSGSLSKRHIEALRLINYSGRWYLLAWDLQKRATRTFHLARVIKIAAIEGDHAKERFSPEALESMVAAGFGIFIGGEIIEVTFEARHWAAEVIGTQEWHPEQVCEYTEEGTLRMRLPVANPNELISTLLYYGEYVIPLSPPSFVEAYKQRVQAMAAQLLL